MEHLSATPFIDWLNTFASGNIIQSIITIISFPLYWIFFFIVPIYFIDFINKKISARMEMRRGPNRTPLNGFFQRLIDSLKNFVKETKKDYLDKKQIGTALAVVSAVVVLFLIVAIIPFSNEWSLINPSSGFLFLLALLLILKLFLYYICTNEERKSFETNYLNNRTLFQVFVFLIPILVPMLSVIMTTGGDGLFDILKVQGGWFWSWNALHDPGLFLGAISFFMGLLMWTGKSPFKYFSSSSELYGVSSQRMTGMKMGIFYYIEYGQLFVMSAIFVLFFLGGGQSPFDLEYFGRAAQVIQCLIFILKIISLNLVIVWINNSLSQSTPSQISVTSWKFMVPISILGLLITNLWTGFFGLKSVIELFLGKA